MIRKKKLLKKETGYDNIGKGWETLPWRLTLFSWDSPFLRHTRLDTGTYRK